MVHGAVTNEDGLLFSKVDHEVVDVLTEATLLGLKYIWVEGTLKPVVGEATLVHVLVVEIWT